MILIINGHDFCIKFFAILIIFADFWKDLICEKSLRFAIIHVQG
jgi:hypothetical protein